MEDVKLGKVEHEPRYTPMCASFHSLWYLTICTSTCIDYLRFYPNWKSQWRGPCRLPDPHLQSKNPRTPLQPLSYALSPPLFALYDACLSPLSGTMSGFLLAPTAQPWYVVIAEWVYLIILFWVLVIIQRLCGPIRRAEWSKWSTKICMTTLYLSLRLHVHAHLSKKKKMQHDNSHLPAWGGELLVVICYAICGHSIFASSTAAPEANYARGLPSSTSSHRTSNEKENGTVFVAISRLSSHISPASDVTDNDEHDTTSL